MLLQPILGNNNEFEDESDNDNEDNFSSSSNEEVSQSNGSEQKITASGSVNNTYIKIENEVTKVDYIDSTNF